MKGIQLGHEVLSLFGASSQQQILNKKLANFSWLLGVFLIVVTVSLSLVMVGKFLKIPAVTASSTSITVISGNEQVAFQPSQEVVREISRGYLGTYQSR